MTAPFVTQLRARATALQLATDGELTITVRVEMPEVWDTVKAVVSPSQPVSVLKSAALAALYPTGAAANGFVLTYQGWEVLDESASLATAGATDGSIFLLTHRRRRPVR
jgi:hypothetical protein